MLWQECNPYALMVQLLGANGCPVTGGRVERRLAAVLAADVAGYSRLMGADEVGTARTLREHRAVTDALVEKHGGRLVKSTGDGVLLEFSLCRPRPTRSLISAMRFGPRLTSAMTATMSGLGGRPEMGKTRPNRRG